VTDSERRAAFGGGVPLIDFTLLCGIK